MNPIFFDRPPTPVRGAPASRPEVLGSQRLSQSALADAAGVAEVVYGPVANRSYWRVQTLTVSTDSFLASVAKVYVGAAVDANLVDGSKSGNLAFSDRAEPIVVPGGQTLRIRWTGMTPGARATGLIQYESVAWGG